MSGQQPIMQCGECSILFIIPATQELRGRTYKLCPNRACHAPIRFSEAVMEAAISWAFMHIINHSGISEARRMNLRNIAESQMAEWDNIYRSF